MTGALAGESFRVRSTIRGAAFEPALSTRSFVRGDAGVADFYATDIDAAALAAGADLTDLTGTIVHVRYLIPASAGDTPIAESATNATVRVLIFDRGAAGMYAGGGFVMPSTDVGERTASCVLRGVSLRLTHATPGFRDALGPSQASLSMRFPAQPERAGATERAMVAILEELPLVGPSE